MSVQWIICGAGKGVGKTVLAQGLCKILPESIYAKCGHRAAKTGKPGNFFTSLDKMESFIRASIDEHKHLVLESNRLAMKGCGDITIFIDGIPGKTAFRLDAKKLRQTADILISADARPADWKKTLAAKVTSRHLREAVYAILISQKRYLFGTAPTVKSKIWFEAGGGHIFGLGIVKLLENIDRSGTLQDAAKTANMSYRYAWDLIRTAEIHLGKILIERQAGGEGGGGSALSDDGKRLLGLFKQLNKEVADFADKRFVQLYKQRDVRA